MQMKMKADLLTEGEKIPNQSVEFLCPEYKTEEQYMYIGTSPCIASCMTPELLYCHLLISDEQKKENFVHTVMDNTKTAHENGRVMPGSAFAIKNRWEHRFFVFSEFLPRMYLSRM